MKPHMQSKQKLQDVLYRDPQGTNMFSRSHSEKTHKQAKRNCRLSTFCFPACNNFVRGGGWSLQNVKTQLRPIHKNHPLNPAPAFFSQTIQGSEGFNKLSEASSSRRPLALFVFQAGEPLCMTIY